MRRLAPLTVYSALLLGLTAGLYHLGAVSAPDTPAVTFAQSADTVEAYDFVEVTATVPKPTAKNPFTDVALTGQFRRGDAAPVTIQGFCDSADGGTYRIRFMPSRPGKHTYEVAFRQGGAERTHAGTFEATDGKRRGVLRVDKDHPWHFVWEGTGEHYFWNGNTAFLLMGWQDEKVMRDALDRQHCLKVNGLRVLLGGGRSSSFWGEPIIPNDRFHAYLNPWIAERPSDRLADISTLSGHPCVNQFLSAGARRRSARRSWASPSSTPCSTAGTWPARSWPSWDPSARARRSWRCKLPPRPPRPS